MGGNKMIMQERDYIDIGTTPTDESCLQAPYENPSAAREEARRYREFLHEVFAPVPDDIEFRVKSNPHDFGSYYSLQIWYTQETMWFALWVEGNEPQTWDVEIEREKAQAKLSQYQPKEEDEVCPSCGMSLALCLCFPVDEMEI